MTEQALQTDESKQQPDRNWCKACDDFSAAVKCSANLSTAGPNSLMGETGGVEEGSPFCILDLHKV